MFNMRLVMHLSNDEINIFKDGQKFWAQFFEAFVDIDLVLTCDIIRDNDGLQLGVILDDTR